MELIFTIAIIGIVIGISAMTYSNYRAKTESQRNYNRAKQIVMSAEGLEPPLKTTNNSPVIGSNRPIYSSQEVQLALDNFSTCKQPATSENHACPLVLLLDEQIRNNLTTTATNQPSKTKPELLRYSGCRQAPANTPTGFVVYYWDSVAKTIKSVQSGKTTGVNISCI